MGHELQEHDLTIGRARRLVEEASVLCETSRDLASTSLRLMEQGDMKRSWSRTWLQSLEAVGHKSNGQALAGMLELAIEVTDAQFGNIQVYDASERTLRIVVHQGFEKEFLEYFDAVHADTSACGKAMRQKRRVIISDVATNPTFSGESREIMLRANVLAVQSTPLLTSSGRLLGMLSTHYCSPQRPASRALPYLELVTKRLVERLAAGPLTYCREMVAGIRDNRQKASS